MPSPDRRESREYQMRVAIDRAAGMTLADFRVFNHLLTIADFGTGHLPDRFQPRSLAKLAEDSHICLSQLKNSVNHLQRHGWLERHRNFTDNGIGGRGHPTRYVLCLGRDCDCESGQSVAGYGKKQATQKPRNRPRGDRVTAGQDAVPAGRARGRGSKEGKLKTEYLGGPVPWDQDDVNDWLSQTEH